MFFSYFAGIFNLINALFFKMYSSKIINIYQYLPMWIAQQTLYVPTPAGPIFLGQCYSQSIICSQ